MKVFIMAICMVIMIACLFGLVCYILMLIKNENTFKNQMIINQAISDYNMSKINAHEYDKLIDRDLMLSYDESFRRIFDWGYKNILPPDKFELIKPYIKTEKGGDVK